MADETSLDLNELRHLYFIAKRPRVLSLIDAEIRHLEKLSEEKASQTAPSPIPVAAKVPAAPAVTYSTLPSFSWDQNADKIKLSEEKASRTAPSPIPATKVPAAPAVTYSTLPSFSWDQDGDKIKMYLSLAGVLEERMETNFQQNSVEFKFHDVEGKNYKFAISKLNKEIVPEKCKVVVKPARVVITLAKGTKGNWLDLHYKEDKLKPNLDKENDPMSGIMDLLKNMYEEGDEEMKRTIAKAWTDARSGKTSDPLKGYR